MRYFYSVCRAEQYRNGILSSHFVFYFRRQMFVKLAEHYFVGAIKVPIYIYKYIVDEQPMQVRPFLS